MAIPVCSGCIIQVHIFLPERIGKNVWPPQSVGFLLEAWNQHRPAKQGYGKNGEGTKQMEVASVIGSCKAWPFQPAGYPPAGNPCYKPLIRYPISQERARSVGSTRKCCRGGAAKAVAVNSIPAAERRRHHSGSPTVVRGGGESHPRDTHARNSFFLRLGLFLVCLVWSCLPAKADPKQPIWGAVLRKAPRLGSSYWPMFSEFGPSFFSENHFTGEDPMGRIPFEQRSTFSFHANNLSAIALSLVLFGGTNMC